MMGTGNMYAEAASSSPDEELRSIDEELSSLGRVLEQELAEQGETSTSSKEHQAVYTHFKGLMIRIHRIAPKVLAQRSSQHVYYSKTIEAAIVRKQQEVAVLAGDRPGSSSNSYSGVARIRDVLGPVATVEPSSPSPAAVSDISQGMNSSAGSLHVPPAGRQAQSKPQTPVGVSGSSATGSSGPSKHIPARIPSYVGGRTGLPAHSQAKVQTIEDMQGNSEDALPTSVGLTGSSGPSKTLAPRTPSYPVRPGLAASSPLTAHSPTKATFAIGGTPIPVQRMSSNGLPFPR